MNRANILSRLIALAVVACFITSVREQRVTAQATSFTISGTVTNSTGQGLVDVTMILVSDVTGTQIVFTDQSGKYVLTYAGGVSHNLTVMAFKPGFIFNPLRVSFISSGTLSGNETVNFLGTASPIPLPLFQTPILLTQENSLRALTLDSVTWMSEPFGVTNPNNFSTDQRTRLTLLATNIELSPGEPISPAIEAQAETSTGQIFPLTVEHFGSVPNFAWLQQVVVKLPNEISNSNEVGVRLRVHDTDGNKVNLEVKP